MKQILSLLHKIAEYGTLLGLTGMILAVTIQVVARFLLPSAPSWTEEISRMFFIYAVAFGVSTGIRDRSFVRLELLQNYITEKSSRKIDIVIQWLIIFFSLLLLYYSYQFFLLGINEQSPSLKISMSAVFASIFVMMFSLVVFSFEHLLELRKLNQPHR